MRLVDDRTRDADEAMVDADAVEETDAISESASAATAANMFAPSGEFDEPAMRAARKRAAIWGFGTGIVMLLIVGLCLVLAILASNNA